MRRITITVADDVELGDLIYLVNKCESFSIETFASAPRPHITRHRPGHTTFGIIMEHFTPSGEFTKEDARRWIVAEGFNSTTVTASLSRLKHEGYLEQIKDGFRFIKSLEEDHRWNVSKQ